MKFIVNFLKKVISIFKKSYLYQYLKTILILRRIRGIFGRIIGNWMLYNFRLHGDIIHLKALKRIVNNYKITSIIETGTYLGYTTMLLAKTFPNLQIYTCEINKNFYKRAKKNLRKFQNVHLYNDNSPKFIEKLIKNKLVGDLPLFYLDAHWLDDWPLEKELQIISRYQKMAVISIDDFKVEKDNRFIFDKYKDKECSLNLVLPNLNKNNSYNLLFPNYGEKEIFGNKIIHPNLIGYVIILQNMETYFKELKNIRFINKLYLDKSYLIDFGN